MEIEFPKSQEAFLLRQVEEGHFLSVAEAVRIAVHDFELRSELERRVLEEERRFVSIGLEEAMRGECATLSQEEIRREGKKLLEQREAMPES